VARRGSRYTDPAGGAALRDRRGQRLFRLLALGFLLFLPLARGPWGAGPPRLTERAPATGK
jgi:hypothetical protein